MESRKSLEIDPIIGSIIEIGNKLGIETYNLKQMYNLFKFKGELLNIYARNNKIENATN